MGRRQIGCNIDVATKEAKSTVGLGCDVADMLVPAQVVTREISGHRGTWQRRRLYMFQLMTVQCVRILHVPGDGNYLNFVRMKFHHTSFLPSS